MFYNYSNVDFTYTWGGRPYTFKAGEVYYDTINTPDGQHPLVLNDVLSSFFAKHLAEFVLNSSKEVAASPLKYNMTNMELLTARGINPPDVKTLMPSFVDELPIVKSEEKAPEPTKEVEEVEKPIAKKLGRPKKVVNSPSEGAEFDM